MSSGFDLVGGHGGGGGHHGGHHGGGRGRGWGWRGGGPGWWGVYDVDELDDGDGVDVDELAEVLARRLEAHKPAAPASSPRSSSSSSRRSSESVTGFDLLGDSRIGDVVDIAAKQRQMNALKQVPAMVGRSLVRGGMAAIDDAISTAKGKWYQTTIPGGTTRENVKGHLQWHADALAKLTDATASYASADDLKKWVMQAFVEENAAADARGYASQNWDKMWDEIGDNLAALPADVRKAAGNIVADVTGLPVWAWALIAAGVAGVVGFGAYRILAAAAPAVGKVAAERYLPPVRLG